MTNEEFNDLTNGDKPTLVKFYADWCVPCMVLSPIVSNIATTYKDRVNTVNIDIEESMDIARKYGVRSIPTVILFNNGEHKVISDKSHDGIKKAINDSLDDFSNLTDI